MRGLLLRIEISLARPICEEASTHSVTGYSFVRHYCRFDSFVILMNDSNIVLSLLASAALPSLPSTDSFAAPRDIVSLRFRREGPPVSSRSTGQSPLRRAENFFRLRLGEKIPFNFRSRDEVPSSSILSIGFRRIDAELVSIELSSNPSTTNNQECLSQTLCGCLSFSRSHFRSFSIKLVKAADAFIKSERSSRRVFPLSCLTKAF